MNLANNGNVNMKKNWQELNVSDKTMKLSNIFCHFKWERRIKMNMKKLRQFMIEHRTTRSKSGPMNLYSSVVECANSSLTAQLPTYSIMLCTRNFYFFTLSRNFSTRRRTLLSFCIHLMCCFKYNNMEFRVYIFVKTNHHLCQNIFEVRVRYIIFNS